MTNKYRVENQDFDAANLVGRNAETIKEHRKRIEPWLAAILQSEHLNVLLGSGFSIALAKAAGVTPAAMGMVPIEPSLDALIQQRATTTAAAMGRGDANIEDQLRVALALVEGMSILNDGRTGPFKESLNKVIAKFGEGIARMEKGMITTDPLDEENVERFEGLLRGFLLSFCARTSSRDRPHIFTTNYDRVIEYGFDLLGIHSIDRFVGSLSPRFRSSRQDADMVVSTPGRGEVRPMEGVTRLTKLHGSIDWLSRNGEIVRQPQPFGVGPNLSDGPGDSLMIYPNSAKDIETAFYPYAELFRDFSASLCRPNAALVTYGYGFGDDHINRILKDMLTVPSTHLVIISYDDPGGRIERFVSKSGKSAQISWLIGPDISALDQLVNHYLPKPAIDLITQRKADLVSRRGTEAFAE